MSGEESNVSLSLGDLQTVLSILDICSQRGAFKGGEMQDVGQLYNHLQTFIKQNKKPEPVPEPENEPESDGNDGEEQQVNTGENKSV
jgi:hypothetical protein